VSQYFWVFLALIFCLPSTSQAEFKPSEHRWTIGYETGITLRYFLGENWEVYLGGGPNDSKGEDTYSSSRFSDDDLLEPYSSDKDEFKTEEGFVYLGAGRTILRDNRFWMATTFAVKYHWKNFQNTDYSERHDNESYNRRQTTGHRMKTHAYLGLRPSYDITSRITLMVGFGVFFSHMTETKDRRSQDEEGLTETRHMTDTEDRVGLYGYYGIDSISFCSGFRPVEGFLFRRS